LLSMMAWSLFLSGSCRADEQILFQDESLVIRGEGHLGIEAKYLSQIYPQAKTELESNLGWKLLSMPTVFLVGNQTVFGKMSGSPFVSAFAIPSEHLIVIHISSMTSRPPILNDTFKHELCHLLLHDHIKKHVIPRWLDEGICQWISGTLGEIMAGNGVTISRISMARRLIPLQQLTLTFPKDKDSLLLAYKEGRDLVEYLTTHYGVNSLRSILQFMEEGDDFDPAVSKSLSKSFQDVQGEWVKDMQKRSEWLIWASQNLYEIIFLSMAVLSVLAFVRLKIRRTRYTGEEGEEGED
jgi:hypothetical protein